VPLVNGRKFLRAQLPTLVTLLAGERAAYQQEVLRLQHQVRELTGQLRELQTVVLVRAGVTAELAALYSERQIMLARAAQHDPTQPLH
jgi:hypothetical protein